MSWTVAQSISLVNALFESFFHPVCCVPQKNMLDYVLQQPTQGKPMLLKKEFYHMCNQIGLEDAEISLAEIVWQKAERAMQGKPLQEPVLLKKTLVKVVLPDQLTQEELQCLTTGLSLVLQHDQDCIKKLKTKIDFLWTQSDRDDTESDSILSFIEMNYWRTLHRKLKKDHSSLSNIQRKLKKQRSK
tara:strand:+ start:1034 stop:1594 length:561 start_codon:yes stop_codon:yes gene_type:complete